MKKVSLFIFVTMILLLAFASCKFLPFGGNKEPEEDHVHEWSEATCKAAKTCSICGERDGSPLSHTMVPADCTTPQTCSVCKQTWGEPLGHRWSIVTCTTPKACRTCGLVETEAPGHAWIEADCTTPKTCETCEATEGEALGHKYEVVIVEPTCTEAGYTSNTCSVCGDSEVTDQQPALGHLNDLVLEAQAPTCTVNGLTEGVQCSRCETVTVKQKVVHAVGHDNELITGTAPSCTAAGENVYGCKVCGEETVEVLEALGHDYGDASCDESAICNTCGYSSGEPIGHVMLPATCTEPSVCKRNCGYTEGEPLGHNMSEANCIDPATCLNGCGYTVGEKESHVLSTTISTASIVYSCTMCGRSFEVENYILLDGTGYDGITGVINGANGYDVTSDADKNDLPVIRDDHYELLRLETTGNMGQLQLWIPSEDKSKSEFTSYNNAVGFLSFKINSYTDQELTMQMIDAGASSDRWSESWCIKDKFFYVRAPQTNDDGTTTVEVVGWDNILLKKVDVTDSDSKFTGWFDVKIGIVLDSETDTITMYYYIDGEYKGYASRALTTASNGINCFYVTSSSATAGSGVMFDDLVFGYTIAGYWSFDEHKHEWSKTGETSPTCSAYGTVSYSCPCGGTRTDIIPTLPHTSDIVLDAKAPTCTEQGLTEGLKCSVCGNVTKKQIFIPALGHTPEVIISKEPTCTEEGFTGGTHCSVCNEHLAGMEILPALGHNSTFEVFAPTCTEDGYTAYHCDTCGEDYVDDIVPAYGHLWAEDVKCDDTQACIRENCGFTSDELVGHILGEPDCITPATCQRGCGYTEGDPLGHSFAPATCTTLPTCTRCEYAEGETVAHVWNITCDGTVLTYGCQWRDECGLYYSVENYYHLDGTDTSLKNIAAFDNQNAYNGSSTALRINADGQYELVHDNNKINGKFDIWVPTNVATIKNFEGFSPKEGANGFLSFSINSYTTTALGMQLVDTDLRGVSSNFWSDGALPNFLEITPPSGDQVTIKGWDADLKTITVGSDKYTGWIDVLIGIQMNSDNTVTLHYYINGEYITSGSKPMTLRNGKIDGFYFTGYSNVAGSGVKFDNIGFGYSNGPHFILDGKVHEWTPATCDAPKTCSCGYSEGESLGGHVWAEDALCTDTKACVRCDFVSDELIGHDFGEATCTEPKTCKRPGCGYSEGEAASHTWIEATCKDLKTCSVCGTTEGNYADHVWIDANCTDSKYCQVCGVMAGVPLGHTWVDATCDAAKSCSVCGLVEGEPLEHDFGEADCNSAGTCVNCGFVSEGAIGHSLKYRREGNTVNYYCSRCNVSYRIDDFFYLDGTDHNGMSGAVNSNYTTSSNALPVIKDGHYELLNTDGKVGQHQLWLPHGSKHDKLANFTNANGSIGFLSFRINAYTNDTQGRYISVKVVDNTHRGTSSFVWGQHDAELFGIYQPKEENGKMVTEIKGLGAQTVTKIEVGEDLFTGWVDITVGIELISKGKFDNSIILHFYIDGKHVISYTQPMPVTTNKINSLYIAGYSTDKGSGYMIDDIVFGYTNKGGHFIFDGQEHAMTEADCTTPAVCSCGYVAGEALGHDYSGAACGETATCQREGCENSAGEVVIDHEWAEATCDAPKHCKRDGCTATEGEALGHDFGDAKCTDTQACIREGCGFTSTDIVGHDLVDPTCTLPYTCTRCNHTEGEPLGHTWDDSANPRVCTVCKAVECVAIGHSFVYTVDGSVLTCTCDRCGKDYSVDNYYYLDGSDYSNIYCDDLSGTDKHFTTDGNGNPLIVTGDDGNQYYQFLKKYSKDGIPKATRMWIPMKADGFDGFSTDNNAVGFVAFKINAFMDNTFKLSFVEGHSLNKWEQEAFFRITPPMGSNGKNKVSIIGWGADSAETKLAEIVTEDNKFTGWIDVMIGIELDKEADSITLHYYINGKYVSTATRALNTQDNSITSICIDGSTGATGSGYMIDDIVFGYSPAAPATDEDETLPEA